MSRVRLAPPFALALALAACGHKSPTASRPDHDLDVGSASAAPSNDTPAPPPPPRALPALAGAGPHAFVADGNGLVEVAPDGKSQQIVAATPRWCSADARARVVWFLTDDGLAAFDLDDRVVHSIVHTQINTDTVMIDWGNEHLGGENKLDYQVALGMRMTSPPKVSSELGCDGDQAVYCYEDDGTTLHAEIVEKRKNLDALALVDAGYVASLVGRGQGRSLWTPPPVPPAAPAAKPKVDRKPCEEMPKDCGSLQAIPGSALWLVITANSRGDFYHQTRELWDPASGEFVSPSNGQLVRGKRPQVGETDYDDLRIATSGVMSIDGVVFDATHVVYAPKGDAPRTCGWSDGGWRMPGPTE